ncbi:MAG TPA: DUF488 family protein [Burkholderiales bacterium]|nr:DUF488 family protein [Burkholderiales bacterium]
MLRRCFLPGAERDCVTPGRARMRRAGAEIRDVLARRPRLAARDHEGGSASIGWLKAVAPSDAPRKWFGHDPARWEASRRRYGSELDANPAAHPRCGRDGRGD